MTSFIWTGETFDGRPNLTPRFIAATLPVPVRSRVVLHRRQSERLSTILPRITKRAKLTEPFWRLHAIKVIVELFGSEFPSASKLLTKDHLKHKVESRLVSEAMVTTESICLAIALCH
jgi:hypothetical protein